MFKSLMALAAVFMVAAPALAESESEIAAPLPRTISSPMRLSPVAGASNLRTTQDVNLDNFGGGFSAGVFADFGSGRLNFETGILTLGATQTRSESSATVNVQNWGVPLLAKLNFSGKPHETIFIKGGAMPFQTTGGSDDAFNIMGVAGVGAALPLGRNSSFLIDASYNRLFTNNGGLTDYQGIAALAGLSFNL